MIWILGFLCIIAAAFGSSTRPAKWGFGLGRPTSEEIYPRRGDFRFNRDNDKNLDPGLIKMKYDINIFGMERAHLIDVPRNNNSAKSLGWIQLNRPRRPVGYCALQLWCPKDDYSLCIHCDDAGIVAGVQVAVPIDTFTPYFDMREQGFTIWTTTFEEDIARFWAISQFFVSPDPEHRQESRDDSQILQDNELWFSGFDGQLTSIATNESELDHSYIKQSCVEKLGEQYYLDMGKDLECTASTISPWSAMYYGGRLIGSRCTIVGSLQPDRREIHSFEHISPREFRHAVPDAPACLYRAVDSVGAFTLTIFYTSTPWRIYC